jgi:stearoyl-CoA desaturase (delta-9 desaturase)
LLRRDWTNIIFIGGLHLLSLLGFYYTPRAIDIALFLTLYVVTGLGITVGYHRLLTHRSFDAPAWLRRTFAWMGAAALQGGPLVWVGTHRRHHRFSDLPGDPHSPRESFWHAHIGWMMQWRDRKEDRAYAKDLARDPFIAWLDKFGVVPWIVNIAICYAVAGPRGVLWGVVICTVFTWNITWSVNSFCHRFGSRPYGTKEGSRNLWWVGLLGHGEGWHNNHHAYQKSALTGETPLQIDLSGYLIRGLEAAGVISNVTRPKRRASAPRLDEAGAAPADVTELISALQNASAAARARVIEALGQTGDERAVDALIPHLFDSVNAVCHAAAVALGQLTPTAESIAALRQVVQQRCDEVAEAAAAALQRLEAAHAAA